MQPKAIEIREFQPGEEAKFREMNAWWIEEYFRMEAKDEQVFADPKGKIIDPGGKIYFALVDGEILAACALLYMAPGEFEVGKMGVAQGRQGGGIGRALLTEVIAQAKQIGARRLYIETSHKLTPAIRLYESLGFTHIPPERLTPSPYQRADVFLELVC